MAQVSLSSRQIYELNEFYPKYQKALSNLRDLHSAADETVKDKAKSELEKFRRSKSADAQLEVKSEIEKSKAYIQKKLHRFQNQGQEKLPEVVTEALAEFNNQVVGTRLSFDDSIKKVGDTLIRGVLTDPKYEITGMKNLHKNSVKEAWNTFNKDLRDGVKGDCAADAFEAEVDHVKKNFQSARDNFLKGLDGLGNDEYETAVAQAVAEFQRSVSKARANFCGTVDTFGPNSAEVELICSEFGRSLANILARDAAKNPVENSSTLEKFGQDVAKIAQRLDGLEKKIQEMSGAT